MNHLIHRVRVELRARSRAAALAAQEATSQALQHDLPAADCALNTRFPENATHRLDRLEVDLGTLPLRGFRRAFMASLLKALTEIEAKEASPRADVHILVSSQSVRRGSQSATDGGDAVDVFLHYIVHGSLPWYFSFGRWREEIPQTLISGEVFSELRARLPSLILEDPVRLLRLLPFPELVSALYASEFRAPAESVVQLTGALPPDGIFAVRLQLALWHLRLNPKTDAKAEAALLRVLSLDHEGALPIVPRDSQATFSTLTPVPATASPPEIARLARLLLRAREQGSDLQRRAQIEVPKRPESSEPHAEDSAQNGLPTESAGLVLLHPFLIRFFQLFGWLDDRLRILDEHRWHAVHAIHWIAHKQRARDEVDLVLETVLCGIPLGEPADWPELDHRVTDEAESLLRAVIRHWKALKDTSPDGLREAFLGRPGLYYPEEPPHLHVETRAYDVLLGRLPWSFDLVALPWLRNPLQVRWPKPA